MESNPALQELLGYSQDELRTKEFIEFIQPEEVARCKDLLKIWWREIGSLIGWKSNTGAKMAIWLGAACWSHLSGVQAVKGSSPLACWRTSAIKNRRKPRFATTRRSSRSVAQELSLTEERERRRLATDLHDQVGQILALAQIKLGALRESAANGQIGPVDEVRQLIEQTIRYTRSVGFELSPPILYDLGFESAVEWLAEQIQEQHGVHIKVAADRSPKPLNDEIRILLFHSVRELLTSMVKRAKPNNVAVLISRNGSSMGVEIENDGLEVDLGAESLLPSPDGLGLFSIRERLQYLGGSLKVESEPGQGTKMSLWVPLKI